MPHRPGTGAIFGIVSENGVAKALSPVYLMDMRRDTGIGNAKILSKQMTREDGGFTFSGLDTEYTNYSVMVSDEDGAEPKNALIQDRIQPVPVHLGAGHFADWYGRIFKDGADSAIIPFPVEENIMRPLAYGGRVWYAGDPANPAELIDIPEIPGMAGIRLNTVCRLTTFNSQQLSSVGPRALEFIIDLDSFSSNSTDLYIGVVPTSQASGSSNLAFDTSSVGSRSASRGNCALRLIVGKNKKVTVYLNSDYDTSITSPTNIGVFDLAAFSGLQHIILNYVPGTSLSLYVGGQLFENKLITANFDVNNARCPGLEIGGTNNGYGVNCLIGPIVTYAESLNAQQALQHYKSLFNNDLIPLRTGYADELGKEFPIWYYRFNDDDLSIGARSELGKYNAVTGAAKAHQTLNATDFTRITHPVSSPFLGQSAFSKPADVYFSRSDAAPAGFPFNNQFVFTGWVYFDTVTPTAIEQLIQFQSPYVYNRSTGGENPASGGWFHLIRGTDKKITTRIFINGALQDRTFNYVANAGQWLNIWLVVNLRTIGLEKASLYIGTETEQPTLIGDISLPTGALFTTASFHPQTSVPLGPGFGCIVGQGMAGRMRDWAILPTVIKPERIVEIWNNKDRP
ncbi:MAG: hypothetical protein RR932_06335 [Acinetobacter sp.]